MPTVRIAPVGRQQFLDSSGDPLNGGLLFTYTSGTTTKEDTYKTQSGSTANTNPIVLDSSGYAPFGIWLTDGTNYKFTLAPSTDADPPTSAIWTEDVITGTNDIAPAGTDQFKASGFTPTYISGTSFSVTGDQTTTLDVGRRLQITDSGGTVYATIATSAYVSITTLTLTVDASDTIDSGISSFNISILTGTNHAVPRITDALLKQSGIPALGAANAFTATNTHTGKIIMSGKAVDWAVHSEAAHATTSDIWAGGNVCLLTGSVVTFTDIADAPQAGAVRIVVPNAAHIFTDGANIQVDGNANFTCVADDVLLITALTTTTFRLNVLSTADGRAVLSATQAQQETGTDTTAIVTPSVQAFHPSAAKAWCEADTAGALTASFNMASVDDDGTGLITFNIATDFSGTAWCAIVCATETLGYVAGIDGSKTAGVYKAECAEETVTPVDPDDWSFIGYGDQA